MEEANLVAMLRAIQFNVFNLHCGSVNSPKEQLFVDSYRQDVIRPFSRIY